jgi:hypothetical protein
MSHPFSGLKNVARNKPAWGRQQAKTMKTEAACSSKTSVRSQRTAQLYIPEDGNLHNLHHENLKSHVFSITYRREAELWYIAICIKPFMVILRGKKAGNRWHYALATTWRREMKRNGRRNLYYRSMVPELFGPPATLVPYTHPQCPLRSLEQWFAHPSKEVNNKIRYRI